MKSNKSLWIIFGLLVATAALYRAWPDRPLGFAPQMALGLFAGAVIREKGLAILLPLVSMFISDVLYQVLYINGLADVQGFYGMPAQLINYILIAGLTLLGFYMKKMTVPRIFFFSISGSLLFFLLSNFAVWAGGGGLGRPKTVSGLLQCYGDGLAFLKDYGVIKNFYGNLFIGDLFFCTVLFGGFYLYKLSSSQKRRQLV